MDGAPVEPGIPPGRAEAARPPEGEGAAPPQSGAQDAEVDPELGAVPLGAAVPLGGAVPVPTWVQWWVAVVLPDDVVLPGELFDDELVVPDELFDDDVVLAAVLVELAVVVEAADELVPAEVLVELAVVDVDEPVAAFAATAPPNTRPVVRAATPITLRTRNLMVSSFLGLGPSAVPTARWLRAA